MRCLTILFVAFSFSATCQNWGWAISGGGSGEDYAPKVIADYQENLYVIGWFSSDTVFFENDTLFTNGMRDIFICKYSSAGNLIWSQSGGGIESEWCYGISCDYSGNSYVVGTFQGEAYFQDTSIISNGDVDGFILKYNSSGQLIWAKQIGGPGYDGIYSIAADSTGNFFVTGWFSNTLIIDDTTLTSSGGADIFIAKFDSSGNNSWSVRAGSADSDRGTSIVLDKTATNLFITGDYKEDCTFSNTTVLNSGDLDIFFAKYDTSGTFGWVRHGGGTGQDFPWDMGIANDNSIYVATQCQFSSDFEGTTINDGGWVTAKYSNSGQLHWVKPIGGSGIGVDKYTGAFFTSIYKYDSTGTELFALPTDALNFRDYIFDENGSAYILGSLWETSFFDNIFLTSNGDIDVYLAKLNPSVPVSENLNYSSINIYPNPATNQINIELAVGSPKALVEVYNPFGQLVYQSAIRNSKSAISVEGFSKGLYLFKVRAGDEVVVSKVVVE